MEPSYSVVADLLAKFHASPDWIKALWLVSVPATVLGLAFCLMRAAVQVAAALPRRRDGALQGHPVFAIYRDTNGRWMVYANGIVQELGAESPAEDVRLPAPRWRH